MDSAKQWINLVIALMSIKMSLFGYVFTFGQLFIFTAVLSILLLLIFGLFR